MAAATGNNMKIFVYGTLKKGQPNHEFLMDKEKGTAQFICQAKTIEKYPLLVATSFNLPFLLNLPDVGNRIVGEVYEVDSTMLSSLDEFEDYPEMYNRLEKQVEVNGGKGGIMTCWVYLLEKYPKKLLDNRQLLDNYDAYSQKVIYTLKEDGCTSDNIYDALEEDCRLTQLHYENSQQNG